MPGDARRVELRPEAARVHGLLHGHARAPGRELCAPGRAERHAHDCRAAVAHPHGCLRVHERGPPAPARRARARGLSAAPCARLCGVYKRGSGCPHMERMAFVASPGFCVALMERGGLWMIGQNNMGQLGIGARVIGGCHKIIETER